MKNLAYIVLFAVTLTSCKGCREDSSIVPLVAVDFTINLNEPDFFDLTNITGWIYLTGGSRGIIIYRNNINQFTAYDRHAPYNVDDGCRVSVDDDEITLLDECSDSSWLIVDGSVISGPAIQPLKQYNTQLSGSLLRVFN